MCRSNENQIIDPDNIELTFIENILSDSNIINE